MAPHRAGPQGEDIMKAEGNDAAASPQATPEPAAEAAPKTLTPAARRALEEAEARRAAYDAAAAAAKPVRELAGRDGPEPVRYGDWELKGITSDF
jgi:hypothetical protein